MIPRLHELPIGDRYRRAEIHFGRGMLALAKEDLESLLVPGIDLPPALEAELRWRLATCCVGLGRADEGDAAIDAALALPGLDDRAVARLESLGLGDRDIEQPVVLGDHPAEAVWSDQQADQDEADDRGDPEAREDRDDEPGRAQYHQRVGHRVGEGFAVHSRSMAGAR